MTPRDVLARLEAEGVTASLKVRFEGDHAPSPETRALLEPHREALIIYLAREYGNTPQVCRLSEQLEPGAVWCRQCYRYQLNPCHPSKKVFDRLT